MNKIFLNRLKSIYSRDEINSIFSILAEHYLGYSKKDLLLKKEETINESKASEFFTALAGLEKHKPVQYITGETVFYGLTLKVNENVLIPRPETEELADWVINDLKKPPVPAGKKIKILDIGTGSGCIAIALKKNLPEAEVSALDISMQALATAGENAKRNNVEIFFFKADILKPGALKEPGDYDVIVSNPPYVRLSEKEMMGKNVLDYEPHTALFVPEENALLYYEAVVNFAKANLAGTGLVYFEINEGLGREIEVFLAREGFSGITLKKDLSGKDRMVKAALYS